MAEPYCGRGQGVAIAALQAPLLRLVSEQLLDELEPIVAEGGIVLDWHTCEAFPERWADLVVVLRCDHTKLWERLEKR